jgi:ElaB/YqjD/DUF883 family membrane-anchored ribosome-binding protein
MDDTTRGVGTGDDMAGRGGEDARGYADTGDASRTPSSGSSARTSPAGRTTPGSPTGGTRSGAEADTDDDSTRRTQEIRAEIEQTREDLSETIDAIQERLRPGNIVSQATDRVKTATTERMKNMASSAGEAAGGVMQQTRETAGQLVEGARNNPVPAILIGVGTTWLLMNRGSARGTSRTVGAYRRQDYSGDYTSGQVYGDERYWDKDNESSSGWFDRIKRNPVPAVMAGAGLAWLAFSNGGQSDDRYDTGWSSSQHRWSGNRRWSEYNESDEYYRQRGADRTSNVYGGQTSDYGQGSSGEGEGIADRTRELASRAQEVASDAGTAIRRRTRRTQNQLQRLMRDNPLLVGAAAMVVGAAVGMALPETEKENEWLGEARDNVVDRAQDLARDAASKVREAAGDLAADVVKGKE